MEKPNIRSYTLLDDLQVALPVLFNQMQNLALFQRHGRLATAAIRYGFSGRSPASSAFLGGQLANHNWLVVDTSRRKHHS